MATGELKAQDSGDDRRTRVFLSYSRRDLAFVERLHRVLEDAGYDALLDKADIAAGEDWKTRLAELLQSADTVVFCVSASSSASKVCGWEVEEAERLGKRILPVVLDGSDLDQVHAVVAKLNFVFFVDQNFEAAFAELQVALNTDLGWMREHTRLGELATDWRASKRRNTGVLRGTALLDAERWISSQPKNAALATDVHRTFIAASRRAQSVRQRNWIAGSLAVVVLSLCLAAWSEFNRRVAVEQTRIATEQRERAERLVETAAETANDLVHDLAMQFRNLEGVPVSVVRNIMDKALGLVTELGKNGEKNDATLRAEAETLKEMSVTLLVQGDSTGSLDAAQRAVAITEDLMTRSPDNEQFQRDHSISLDRLGAVQEALDNVAGAKDSFTRSLEIIEGLAARAPEDKQAQRDLAVGYQNIGDILRKNGDHAGALGVFNRGLVIAEKLAGLEPDNIEVQRDLSVFLDKVGQAQLAQADLEAALQTHTKALKIVQAFAALQPTNTTYQHDLATSFEYVSAVKETKEDVAGAMADLQSTLAIRTKLAATDSGNLPWQRALAFTLESVGRLHKLQGNTADAAESYAKAVAIEERISAADPANVLWLKELSLTYDKLGDLKAELGDAAGALAVFDKSLQVSQTLVRLDPSSDRLQRELAVSYIKMANSGADAVANFGFALEILLKLKAKAVLPESDDALIAELEELVKSGD